MKAPFPWFGGKRTAEALKAVQREIYGQEGGYWFYRIRDAVQG